MHDASLTLSAGKYRSDEPGSPLSEPDAVSSPVGSPTAAPLVGPSPGPGRRRPSSAGLSTVGEEEEGLQDRVNSRTRFVVDSSARPGSPIFSNI